MGKYWIGLLCRNKSQGIRRGDAEPLDKAMIGLGHLRTPIFVVTPFNCVNGFACVLYDECMLY